MEHIDCAFVRAAALPSAPQVRCIAAAPAPETPRRVAAYCRVSTLLPSQRDSLAAQAAHYRGVILSRPDWELAGLYADEGRSGTGAEARPALRRLLADCAAGRIDLILTKSISRFARNTSECLRLVRTLSAQGVELLFEKEGIHTGTMGSELLLSVLACFAEEESRSLSGNLKWGIRKRFANGTYRPSLAPYGYRKEGDTLVIVPEEAALVREMFDRLLAGTGAGSIAAALNQRGLTTRRGNCWEYSQIRAIVSNPACAGDLLCQKTYMDENFRQRKNRGELDQYCYERHHEPIVDRETFALAASVFTPETRSARRDDALSGRVFCARCGCPMGRRQAKGRVTWLCSSVRRHLGPCPNKPEWEGTIRRAFLTMLNKLAFSQGRPKNRVLDAYIDRLDARETELLDAARALRAFVERWRVTKRVSDFPEEAFPSLVTRLEVQTARRVTVYFACGLILSESTETKGRTVRTGKKA